MNKHTGEWPSSQPEIFPEYTLEHSKNGRRFIILKIKS